MFEIVSKNVSYLTAMGIKLLSIGAMIFVGVHLVPAFASLRQRLVDQLTVNGYKILFVVVSWIGLGLMIWGKIKAPHTVIWTAPGWSSNVALLIMLPSMVLLASAKFPTNIKRFTPHPMMWGFILWSVAHLLTNGDLASVILFGSIGAYSIVAILSANARGATLSTAVVPIGKEAVVIGFGIGVYVLFVFLHPYLFGVAVR